MAPIDLHSPEHPVFPRDAEHLRDPRRAPTAHEEQIVSVFSRFRELPDFAALPAPGEEQRLAAFHRLDALLGQPRDPIRDQDERVLDLVEIIADYPALFGKMGFYLAAEIMQAAKAVETSEFRRAFLTEYVPAQPRLREYLRRLAGLRRRAHEARAHPAAIAREQWGAPNRQAAAREQMELVQSLPDYQVMEKYWRMLEIVSAYPDFFPPEQVQKLASHSGIERTWRAHLAKARSDLNYYHNVLKTAGMMRDVVDGAVQALKQLGILACQAGS